VQVNEIVGLHSTQSDAYEQPTHITVYQHKKGQQKRRLVYQLVEVEEVGEVA